VIPTNPNITYLVGGKKFADRPLTPFHELPCAFLHALSSRLREDKAAQQYPDVLTFSFWCRNGNISRLRDEFNDGRYRLGLGNVFHIAPSNVPVNFAFSFAFGLLSGNANFVRVPSKNFAQIEIICNALNDLLAKPEFAELQPFSHLFKYDHQSEITAEFSSISQGRIIWGGDNTIKEIRKNPLPVRSIDIAFADRYSFCCFGAKSITEISDTQLERLAQGFYNDTYLMDQNACSSPHLVVWLGDDEDVAAAKKKFWGALSSLVHKKYQLSSKAVVDKQTLFCQNAIELENIQSAEIKDTALFRIELGSLPENLEALRGNSGYFYEFQTASLDTIASIVTPTYQTVTYSGVDKYKIIDFVLRNRLTGVDRIVPVGGSLDMTVVWDGHHVIQSLSRIIDLR
jgi:hypothetical protein